VDDPCLATGLPVTEVRLLEAVDGTMTAIEFRHGDGACATTLAFHPDIVERLIAALRRSQDKMAARRAAVRH
jgi:hypothetical protein